MDKQQQTLSFHKPALTSSHSPPPVGVRYVIVVCRSNNKRIFRIRSGADLISLFILFLSGRPLFYLTQNA